MYEVDFSDEAKRDLAVHRRSGNIPLMRKINRLLAELAEHPYTGTGKPEALRENLSGYWSRRINHEHRLVYAVNDGVVTVTVFSAVGHYSSG
ncbi:Txe/YoeB family addiction module toxin [Planctomycetales bacterium]|nr:Txe/YoeB family addiction module toxin [Planctomycetales bacterium]GHT02897.1 Txe/YoeB family addiction module toxin [Planctomycetales bacterium]